MPKKKLMEFISPLRFALAFVGLFLAPGFLLYRFLAYDQRDDPIKQTGLIVGASLSSLPVLLLLTASLNIPLTPDLVLAIGTLLTLSAGTVWVLSGANAKLQSTNLAAYRLRINKVSPSQESESDDHRPYLNSQRIDPRILYSAFLILFALTLFVRFYVIRDIQVPMWGDSYQHALIAQLIQEQGKVPNSYLPYAELNRFTYHFGFQTLVAFWSWIAGVETYQATLVVGQILNACAILSAYVFTLAFLDDQRAALLSALLVGLVFMMPAYFVNWGRYTQLEGLVLLPIAFSTVRRFVNGTDLATRRLVFTCIVCAGLALTHYAVAMFLALLIMVYLLGNQFTSERFAVSASKSVLKYGLLLIGTSLLISPWVSHILASDRLGSAGIILTQSPPRIPEIVTNQVGQLWHFIAIRFRENYELLLFGAIGLLWGTLRKSRPVFLLAIWVLLLCALSILGQTLNPTSTLGSIINSIKADTIAISLFLPTSVLVSAILVALYSWIETRTSPVRWVSRTIYFALLLFLVVVGSIRLSNILDPNLELVMPADLTAMSWIQENVPTDAIFLTNMYFWFGNTVMGSDAGYWLPLLGKRKTLVPPLIYTTEGMDRGKVMQLRQIAQETVDGTIGQGAKLCWLRSLHVTHIYVGARQGNPLSEQTLRLNPHVHEIYQNEGAAVFEILPCE